MPIRRFFTANAPGHTNMRQEYDRNGAMVIRRLLQNGERNLTGENNSGKSADKSTDQSDADVLASCDVTQEDIDKLNSAFAPRHWLEVLPSRAGVVFAALLT